ncbi:hypothetical protein EIP91_010341 [Steccherinum ochraceum]|uniref:DUF6532 domain-containing protein n=1 Tax=Steccherinum ochraceum TaxID=92696 RepID=A0A4R0R0R1_9APHY|nr:hypothetical protein EIP91_010341 [Steccherinum ochraceum]
MPALSKTKAVQRAPEPSAELNEDAVAQLTALLQKNGMSLRKDPTRSTKLQELAQREQDDEEERNRANQSRKQRPRKRHVVESDDENEDDEQRESKSDEPSRRFTSEATPLKPVNLNKHGRVQRMTAIPSPPRLEMDDEAYAGLQDFVGGSATGGSPSQSDDEELPDEEPGQGDDNKLKDLLKSLKSNPDVLAALGLQTANPRTSLKRSAPAHTDISTTRVTKVAKRTSGQSKKGLKLSDYSGSLQRLIKATQMHFRCKIFTYDAFPDPEVELQLVTTIWAMQCEHSGVDVELEDEYIKLIAARGSECRGRIKEFIRPVVVAHFGLKDIPINNIRQGRKLRETVEAALEDLAFIYKDPVARKQPYLADVLIKAVYAAFFKKSQRGVAVGIKYPEYFSPTSGITLPTVALIITVIEHILSEYKTGHRKSEPFTQTEFEGIYRRNLRDLEYWAKPRRELVAKWRVKMISLARDKAGAADDDDTEPGLARGELDAAAEEMGEDDIDNMGVESEEDEQIDEEPSDDGGSGA